jgi:hypothetical protein
MKRTNELRIATVTGSFELASKFEKGLVTASERYEQPEDKKSNYSVQAFISSTGITFLIDTYLETYYQHEEKSNEIRKIILSNYIDWKNGKN